TSTTQITITIQGANDAPTAVADTATAVEAGGVSNGTAGTNPTGNVLNNDTDIDSGDTKTVSGVAAGVVGSASTNVGTNVTGTYGTINISSTGSFTYTVDNSNAAVQALRTTASTLTDTFTYTMRDTAGLTSTTQITITIQGANDAPTAVADTATAVEAGGVSNGTAGTNPTGNVLTNDTDFDSGDTKTVSGVAAGVVASASTNVGADVTGTYGTINISSTGAFTYTVDNSNAAVQALRTLTDTIVDVFTYSVTDAGGLTSTGTISISITGSNDRPTAVNDTAIIVEAGGIGNATGSAYQTGNILVNDTDPDAGDTKTVTAVAFGSWGSVLGGVGSTMISSYGTMTVNANGTFTYWLDNSLDAVEALRTSGNTLQEVFTYTMQDTAGTSSTAQITIMITGGNDAPQAVADSFAATEARGFANTISGINPVGNVLSNDTDIDSGDTQTIIGVAAGVVSSATSHVGTSLSGAYGSITIAADGSMTYIVDQTNATVQGLRLSSDSISDLFTYTMRDAEGLTSTTQVTVRITGGNDAPTAVADQVLATEAGGHGNATPGVNPTGNLISNDVEPDSGDTITVIGIAFGNFDMISGSVGSSVSGDYGTIVVAGNGSYSYTVDNSNATVQALRTTADRLYETFTYTVQDTFGYVSTAQVTVTIQGAKDASTAIADTLIAVEAGGINNASGASNPTGNLLSNDTSVDAGDTLTVTGLAVGTGTPVSGLVGTVITGTYGTLLVQSDGTFSYQVDNNSSVVQALRTSSETLSETFTYTMQDSTGLSSSALVTVVIRGNNDTVVGVADSANAVESGGVGNATAGVNPTGNVLTNDTDIDAGDTKTVVGVGAGTLSSVLGGVGVATLGSYGTLTIAANGSYTYVVNNSNSAVQVLRTSGTTLSDVFTYEVQDAAGATAMARLTIVISGANDAPTASSDLIIAQRTGANGFPGVNPSGNVLSNDTDPDHGDTRSVIGIGAGIQSQTSGNVGTVFSGSFGSITLNSNGSYSYVVDNNNASVLALSTPSQWIQDTFTYTISDASGLTSSTQIYVRIYGAGVNFTGTNTIYATEAGGYGNLTAGLNPSGDLTATATDVITGVAAGSTDNTLPGNVGQVVSGSYGTITIAANGTYSYTVNNSHSSVQSLRNSSQSINDVFSYTVEDSHGNRSEWRLTVAILGANDAPDALADTFTAIEAGGFGNSNPVGTDATGNVLTNDTDVDFGDTQTVIGIAAGVQSSTTGQVGTTVTGSYGSITVSENGSIIYTVNNDNAAVQALRTEADSLQDVFSYTIRDLAGLTSTVQISIVITGSNDVPTAVDDQISAQEAGGYSNSTVGVNPAGNVLTNDIDPDSGDTKTVIGVIAGTISQIFGDVGTMVNGTYGTITIAADGTYLYTVDNSNTTVQGLLAGSAPLSDLFTYTMRDTYGEVSTAQVRVLIYGSNDAPVAITDNLTAVEAGGLNNATAGSAPAGNLFSNDQAVDSGDTWV
ncbi:MAG: beta strand repeat-containing protein, partial [Planctomyces sp.]